MGIAVIGTVIGIISGIVVILTLTPGLIFPDYENQPPIAVINSPNGQYVGEPVYFVSNSRDLDGKIVSYSWDFGDGSTSSSKQPIHTYDEVRSYEVKLTVTDNHGDTDTTSKSIQISRKTTEITNSERSISIVP